MSSVRVLSESGIKGSFVAERVIGEDVIDIRSEGVELRGFYKGRTWSFGEFPDGSTCAFRHGFWLGISWVVIRDGMEIKDNDLFKCFGISFPRSTDGWIVSVAEEYFYVGLVLGTLKLLGIPG